MTPLPPPTDDIAELIYSAYQAKRDSGHRPHLGCSILGHACPRHIWLQFRWTHREKHPGRILRLFETGQHEEPRVVADLRAIGCEVWDVDPTTGRQFRVEGAGGHLAGSLDGIVRGVPGAPAAPHVLEIKTHSDKSFNELQRDGVQKSKPQHFAQMQAYMGLTGIDRALYLAVCKNTDAIYTERIAFDRAEFERLMALADAIIMSDTPPPRISTDPAWYQCKMCPFHGLCHEGQPAEKNCRTCIHAQAVEGAWNCGHYGANIPTLDDQRRGCANHQIIPDLAGVATTPAVIEASPPPAAPLFDPPLPLEVTPRIIEVIRRVAEEQPEAKPARYRTEIISQCGRGADKGITDEIIAAVLAALTLNLMEIPQ